MAVVIKEPVWVIRYGAQQGCPGQGTMGQPVGVVGGGREAGRDGGFHGKGRMPAVQLCLSLHLLVGRVKMRK